MNADPTPARSHASGFLAVFSDVKPADDRDYFDWLTTEHVQERLGIEGFLGTRIFRMPIEEGHRYFIWYRLQSAAVVDSPAYLARLNNPTPWSARIMPILGNFARGGGAVMTFGGSSGECLLCAVLPAVPSNPEDILQKLKANGAVTSAHFLVTDPGKSEVRTNERDLRTSNMSFAGLLVVESNNQDVLRAASASISEFSVRSNTEFLGGLYRQVFALAT